MSYFDYEKTLLGYLENIKAQILSRPLNLGGVTGSGGGAGGGPGGFIGQLPQSRVCYDLSEAEDNTIPTVSGNLVDNLNHIRYRLHQLEEGTGPGSITIKENGVLVASGITVVDFYNADVAIVSPTEVSVTVTSSGTSGGGSTHSHKYNVTLSGTSHFTTPEVFSSGTLRVYYNGIRQDDNYFTADGGRNGFTLVGFAAKAGDEIFIDYDIPASGGSSGGGGHIIQDEGSDLPQRSKLNFVGVGLTVTDDSANDATKVTLTLGSGGGGAPLDSYYILGVVDSGLENAIVLPETQSDLSRLAAVSPTANANGMIQEFDGTDPLTWSITPNLAHDCGSTIPSYYYISFNDNVTHSGVMSWTPSRTGVITLVTKLEVGCTITGSSTLMDFMMIWGDSVLAEAYTFGYDRGAIYGDTFRVFGYYKTGGVTWTGITSNPLAFYSDNLFFKVTIDFAADTTTFSVSETGRLWTEYATLARTPSTLSKLGLYAFSNTGTKVVYGACDFIRVNQT